MHSQCRCVQGYRYISCLSLECVYNRAPTVIEERGYKRDSTLNLSNHSRKEANERGKVLTNESSGGRCVDMTDGYRCVCPVGFNGTNCEWDVDDCRKKPCQNQGICEDRVSASFAWRTMLTQCTGERLPMPMHAWLDWFCVSNQRRRLRHAAMR